MHGVVLKRGIPSAFLFVVLVLSSLEAGAGESGPPARSVPAPELKLRLDVPSATGDYGFGLTLEAPGGSLGLFAQAAEPGSEGFQVEQSRSFVDWGGYLFLGLTIASAAVAAITGGLFFKHRRDMSLSTRGTQRWRDFKGFVRSEAIATNIMIGVTSASLVTTIVLFVLRPDEAESKTVIFGE